MSVATPRTLRDLELAKVLATVAELAACSLGAAEVRALQPLPERTAALSELELVQEMISVVRDGFTPGGIGNLEPLLEKARDRGHLAPEEFLEIVGVLEAGERMRKALTTPHTPRLASLVGRLSDQASFVTAVHKFIDDRGALREDATPKLRELNQSKRRLAESITRSLRSFLDSHRELAQETVVTQRGGRYVVPLRSGAPGLSSVVVHDSSSSGQTVFAEPASVVPMNNRLREVEDGIWREHQRILAELTSALLAQEGRLRKDLATFARVDGLFARARYALLHRAEIPKLVEDGTIEIVEARHPLLGERAVPVSLRLIEHRLAVITGPNTGGKTVCLKTIGLLTLMAQCGIPVPASPRTMLTVFPRVRSDIGEEQSIEQNLSTFSSHMSNIVSILNEVDDRTLVLLDELGAGTDPQEGAALGLSTLERLLEVGCTAAVATHLTPVKHFAISHPGILSCSMEFDLETLSPTYRVLEGVPGRSCALIIAERLGLPRELVARARSRLTSGEIRADEVIAELGRERAAARRIRADLELERDHLRRLRTDYERRLSNLREKKGASLGTELERLEREITEARNELGTLIAQARQAESAEARRAALRRLEDVAERIPSQPERHLRPIRVAVGQVVRIRPTGAVGTVRHLQDQTVEVEVKGRRVELPRAAVEPIEEPPPPRKAHPQISARSEVSMELSVRGMTVAEARMAVEAWLDKLLLAGVQTGRLVHGKGTGALRQGLHAYLARAPFVRRFYHAPPAEGGDGVTIVEL